MTQRLPQLPDLRDDQKTIIRTTQAVGTVVVAMGRRWGKSFTAGVLSLTIADHGGSVAWVAPNYRNSRPLWRFVERYTAGTNAQPSRSERIVSFPSGGQVGIYSADNADSMRGESFHLCVVDEAARVSEEAWTDVIQPTLADHDGRAVLISTPHGRNWFWREWQRGMARQDGYAAFTAPSSANPNPNIKRAFEMARERVSERTFRQEWLAEFVEDGTFFPNVDAVCIAAPAPEPLLNHTYVIGVDWARAAGGDYTVFAVMDATTRTMAHLQRMNGADYETQKARLKALVSRFRVIDVLAEYNSMGGPLVEALQRDGLPVRGFTTTVATKHEIISALELAMDQKSVMLLNDDALRGELSAYEKTERSGGLPAYGAPDGMHDDTVIAAALAWHAAMAQDGMAGFAMNYMR